MPPCLGKQEPLAVDQDFHHFPLKIGNATQHESCVLRKTRQLSYWEILECLGEISRTFKDIRVLMWFDRDFDQGLTTSVCGLDQDGH
jgi:hypothetical protein